MFRNSLIWFVCLLLALIACEQKSSTSALKPIMKSNADSSLALLQIDDENYYSRSVSYRRIEFFRNNQPKHSFIRLIETQSYTAARLETQTELSLMKSNAAHAVSYQLVYPADGYAEDFGCIQLRHTADEDGEDSYWLINPENGKEVIRYTFNRLTVLIPNSKEKRFFGFLARSSQVHPDLFQDKSCIGYLYYSSNEQSISAFKISVKDEQKGNGVQLYTPGMEFIGSQENQLLPEQNQLILMSAPDNFKSTDVKGFGLRLKFYVDAQGSESEMEFTVKDDAVSIRDAKWDKEIFSISEFKAGE